MLPGLQGKNDSVVADYAAIRRKRKHRIPAVPSKAIAAPARTMLLGSGVLVPEGDVSGCGGDGGGRWGGGGVPPPVTFLTLTVAMMFSCGLVGEARCAVGMTTV